MAHDFRRGGARSLVWLEHPADNRKVVGSNPTGPMSQQAIVGRMKTWPSQASPIFGMNRSVVRLNAGPSSGRPS